MLCLKCWVRFSYPRGYEYDLSCSHAKTHCCGLATGIGVAQSAAKAGLPAPAAQQPASAPAPGNWPAGGRDQQGTYYSPLTQINSKNIDQLGFAWSYDLGTYRGQEATPIVVDGVMYTSGTWGYVYAVDAATGKRFGGMTHTQATWPRDTPVVTSSIVASQCGRAGCTSLRSTAGSMRSMRNRRKGVGSRHDHRSQDAVLQYRRATDSRTRRCDWQQRR